MKVINPLENNEKVIDLESVVQGYYDLVKNTTDNALTDNLMQFQDFDVESHYNETGSLDIDLKSLLKID